MYKKLFIILFSFLLAVCNLHSSPEKIKALVLTGQSNKFHNWQAMNTVLKRCLDDAGIFDTEVLVSPAIGEDFHSFNPQWSRYDVIVLDYDGDEWPLAVKDSFENYLKGGGGLVLVHASNNAFPHWEAYQEIIGLGGWGHANLYDPPLERPGNQKGGRNEAWGPRVHWQGCEAIHENSAGRAFHPRRHDFLVTVRDHEHPVTQGLPEMWLHEADECYSGLRGPAQNLDVLATGFANPIHKKASPYNEPVLFTVRYGEGRIFQTTLGHIGPNQGIDAPSVRNVGFILAIQRAAEWCATGQVTIPVTDDFPNAYSASVRPPVESGWTDLLDDELSMWEVFMGIPHATVTGLPAGTFQAEDVREGTPLGLNNDPKGVFSTRKVDGEVVLHITGEIYGGLTTREDFENYHFSTQFRWLDKKWEPRLNRKRDSGILYHCYGEHGAFWNVWKRSLEYQVQEQDFGDFIPLRGTQAKSRVRTDGKKRIFDLDAEWEYAKGYLSGFVEPDAPHGEWNTLEIFVVGDAAIHVVNGKVVLAIKDALNDKGEPLTKGQIQIQSEAAECEYRDMKIRPITELPELLKIKSRFDF